MKYFMKRELLFRLNEETLAGARWDDTLDKWVDVGLHVVQEAVWDMRGTYTEVTEAQVYTKTPDAFSGDQSALSAPPVSVDDYDALTVAQMANIMGAVSSKGTFADWFPTSGMDFHDAPVARKFWDEMVRENAALKPGQTLAPPSEWS